jgi:hypothetical protein
VVRQWEDYSISPSEKMDDLINRTTRLLIDLELVGEKKSITSILEKVIRNLPWVGNPLKFGQKLNENGPDMMLTT